MISTIVAYDDNDSDLGDYFVDSHENITVVLRANAQIVNVSIRGLDCTEVFVNSTITPLNGNRFIFIGISHGNEEELVSHEVYVSASNLTSFSNSLFYSCACLTGLKLGKNLIGAGCLVFVGYNDTVLVNVDYFEIFYNCQNHCIKEFLKGNETIEGSFSKMIDYYNEEIDKLLPGDMDDLLAATSLINNRDCLILLGDRKLRLNDFEIA